MTDKNPLAHYSGVLSEAVQESAAADQQLAKEQTPICIATVVQEGPAKWNVAFEWKDGAFCIPGEYKLYTAPTQAAPAAVAVPDERAAFEKWASFVGHSIERWRNDRELYDANVTDEAWIVWQARAALAATPAAAPGMVSVTKEDANNYCRILAALGMEEEGDPVVEVQNLLAAAAAPVVLPEPTGLIAEKLLALARIVNTAVEDWGESSEDNSMDVKFHSDVVTEMEAILDYFDSLPDGPDENVIESGPAKAARILRALLAGVSAPAGAVQLDFGTLREIVDGLHSAWGEAQGYAYCPSSKPYSKARKRAISMHGAALSYIGALESFSAQAQADSRDAARYRWLRNESWACYNLAKKKPEVALVAVTRDGAGNIKTVLAEDAMDEAIDAAIAAQAAKEGAHQGCAR